MINKYTLEVAIQESRGIINTNSWQTQLKSDGSVDAVTETMKELLQPVILQTDSEPDDVINFIPSGLIGWFADLHAEECVSKIEYQIVEVEVESKSD